MGRLPTTLRRPTATATMARLHLRRTSVLVLPIALALGGCASDSHASKARPPQGLPTTTVSSTTTSVFAACTKVPPAGPALAWLPHDLPLPPGTYATTDISAGGLQRGMLVVPTDLHGFVVFALQQWPKVGFRLGRGDAEAHEAEDSFSKGDRVGAFRARSVYCDQSKTELLLVVGTRQPLPTTPTTSGRPLTP